MKNIWKDLKKPLFIQAPLDDVSDTVFRQILLKTGKPDIFFTEFTNTDGLCSKGRPRVMRKLQHTPSERPLIAQLWGKTPEHYFESARLITELEFDGVDINMGCPERSIVKNGCCSALIRNHPLAAEIIQATKEGLEGKLPLSVKTRLGFDTFVTEEWVGFLLEQNLDAITLHGRIAVEMSKFPAKWDEIGKAVQLRNAMKKDTIIIGNGDVISQNDAQEKIRTYGVDGVMIGRGMFSNIWIFDKTVDPVYVSKQQRLQLLLDHIQLYVSTWEGKKSYNFMKKFYKVYIHEFDGAAQLREELNTIEKPNDVISYLSNEISKQQS